MGMWVMAYRGASVIPVQFVQDSNQQEFECDLYFQSHQPPYNTQRGLRGNDLFVSHLTDISKTTTNNTKMFSRNHQLKVRHLTVTLVVILSCPISLFGDVKMKNSLSSGFMFKHFDKVMSIPAQKFMVKYDVTKGICALLCSVDRTCREFDYVTDLLKCKLFSHRKSPIGNIYQIEGDYYVLQTSRKKLL